MTTSKWTQSTAATLLFGAIAVTSPQSSAQCVAPARLEWVGTNGVAGGALYEEPIRHGIGLDPYGNCGLVGSFDLQADLDPTDGVRIVSPMGLGDGTVNLVDPKGAAPRVGLIGGGFSEACGSNSATRTGDWRYCGTFGFGNGGEYCGDLDPYEGVAIHCTTGAPRRGGTFISYVSREGQYEHGVLLAGDSEIYGKGIASAPDEGAVVTGWFTGTVDLDPGEGEFVIREYMHRDAYLLKLNASGEFEWGVAIGGYGQDQGQFVTTDAQGNIYWMGRFNDLLDFDPGPGEDKRYGQSGELFVCKYTSDGQYVWTRTVNTKESHLGYTLDASRSGTLMISGYFKDNVDFDPTTGTDDHRSAGDRDAFVSLWTSDGDYLWTATWGGIGWDTASAAFEGSGAIIVKGGFSETIDFDPGAGEDFRTSNGGLDAYVGRLTREGEYQWTQTWGGALDDAVDSVAVNRNNGDIWLDGLFRGTVDFDPGPGEAFRTSVGERDLFLMKMTCDGRGCEELTGHSADGRMGEIESQVATTLTGGKASIKLEGDALRFKQKARLAADGSGSTTFRNLPPGRYRAVVAKLKDAEGTRVCNGELMERFVEVR